MGTSGKTLLLAVGLWSLAVANPIPVHQWRQPTQQDTAMALRNVDDSVLVVYQLTAQQEAQFSAIDGQPSPFWDAWDGADQVTLYPPDYCVPGACDFTSGAGDASVLASAAADSRGFYMLVTVQDDTSLSQFDMGDTLLDAVQLVLDILPSATIQTCADCRIGNGTALTRNSMSFTVMIDTGQGISGFFLGRYDTSLSSWTSTPLMWAAARSRYGLELLTWRLSSTRWGFELYIPWDRYCGDFPYGDGDLGGQHFAFAIGYGDKDAVGVPPGKIWLKQGSPAAPDASLHSYWGDLYFDPLTVPGAMGTGRPGPVTPGMIPSDLHLLRSGSLCYRVDEAGPVTVALYDTRGALVHTLVNAVLAAGTHTASWDSRLPAGCYVARMQTAGRFAAAAFSVTR